MNALTTCFNSSVPLTPRLAVRGCALYGGNTPYTDVWVSVLCALCASELCMGVSDLVNLIKQGNKRLDKIVGLASTIMQAFDDDGNNEIEQVEFLDMVSKNSTWLDAFANFVSVPVRAQQRVCTCMAEALLVSHHTTCDAM